MESSLLTEKTRLTVKFSFEVWSLALLNNMDYFFFFKSRYWYSEKYVCLLQSMLSHVQWYEIETQKLKQNMQRFDVTGNTPGNGFRSFDIIFDRFFNECYVFCKELCAVRDSVFFMPDLYLKKLKAHVGVLDALKKALTYILKMIDENQSSQPLIINKNVTAEEVIKEYGLLDQKVFYGRCQGFYFCSSMRKTLWGVSVIMASFSDLYQKSGGPLSRAVAAILNGVKYILDPELRSQQIVTVAQNSSVEFLQSFWSLSKTHFMKTLPKWICPQLEVLEELLIPAEAVPIDSEDGSKTIIVPAPSSHIPKAPVRCLFMSYVHRKGQLAKGKVGSSKSAPLSPALLFHCHGGGFVSQTPETHEIYLRHWAHDLNIPILSVDYSLAPHAPFPRALEEVLLAYAWALKNAEKLGWTGERICFAGDSAGGNILMGTIIKLISLKIRKPDAILCAYSPLILDLVPSPSRLLCWLDPLLPIGFMISCLDAYIGAMHTDNNEYAETSRFQQVRERKLSSISEIVDFLKEPEWTEINPNEPDTKETIRVKRIAKDDSFSSSLHLAEDDNVLESSDTCEIDMYVNNFLDTYLRMSEQQCDDDAYNCKEFLVYNFPQDFVYDVSQKCGQYFQSATRNVNKMLQQNKWYNMYISPFIPTSLFQSKSKEPENSRTELSIAQKIRRLKVVSKNPYISPLLVSEEVLKEMPQIYFMSLNFDPCLDDSITFSKRMAAVGKPVVLDMLDGLPHGFLNFLPFSKEAHDGSDVCVKRIKEALKL